MTLFAVAAAAVALLLVEESVDMLRSHSGPNFNESVISSAADRFPFYTFDTLLQNQLRRTHYRHKQKRGNPEGTSFLMTQLTNS